MEAALPSPACYSPPMTSAAPAERMSYANYLAFERASDTKHEYVNGQVYAMAGGSPEHARLQVRTSHLLTLGLAGRPCAAFSSDLRVRIEATGRSTYPDVTVICDRIQRAADDPDAATNPILVVEVLSETSEREDRGSKWAHYQRIPSLRHYVLISQDERRVEVYTREPRGWLYSDIREGSVELSALNVSLDIDELYAQPFG